MYNLENNLLQPEWPSSQSYFDYYSEQLKEVNTIDRLPESAKITVHESYEGFVVDDSLSTLDANA